MKKLLFIILFLAAAVYAANEIRYIDSTGQQRYCKIARSSDLKMWDTVALAYATSPTWANAAIDLTENADINNVYLANMPTSTAGTYYILMFEGTKATAANTDDYLDGYDFNWNGSSEITLYQVYEDTNDIQEDWATCLVYIQDILTDTNDIQEDWAGLLADIAFIIADVNQIPTTTAGRVTP